MAGSYNHIINRNGDLQSNSIVANMLENGGDVYEAVEEMYGMIWYLAAVLLPVGSSLTTKSAIEEARQNYQVGLRMAKAINASLDNE
jgi:hypothetical protein